MTQINTMPLDKPIYGMSVHKLAECRAPAWPNTLSDAPNVGLLGQNGRFLLNNSTFSASDEFVNRRLAAGWCYPRVVISSSPGAGGV